MESNVIEQLIENIDEMIEIIEEQENVNPDFLIVREIAEQLKDEIQVFQSD